MGVRDGTLHERVFTNPAALLPPHGVACGRKGTARAVAGAVCGKGTDGSLALQTQGLVVGAVSSSWDGSGVWRLVRYYGVLAY